MKLEKFYHDTTQLLPDVIDMETDTELPQYFIQSWQLKYMKMGGYSLIGLTEWSNLYRQEMLAEELRWR